MDFWTAIWQSIVLGTVQGLTEFLPVSSSGHLSLLHKLFGEDFGGNSLFFDIMLHVGTLLAVVIVLRKEIFALFRKPYQTLLMLLVATVPAGVVGLLFSDRINAAFSGENGVLWLAVCFAFTAILLLACEEVSSRRKTTRPLGWGSAMTMGVIQAIALFPGISRSGSTISAGVFSGADRKEVARFSFLLSIPVILGSALVNGIDVVKTPEAVTQIGAAGFTGIAVGMVCAAVSGFFAIKFMLRIVERANYKWFSLYLLALSLVSLSLCAAGVIS